jgi:hypothetical protein
MANLKENYILANCCRPGESDAIIGYYSHNNVIKVHKSGCRNLSKADAARLMSLRWADITIDREFRPESDYNKLDLLDFRILRHHQRYGVDYSLKVAALLHIDIQAAFERHDKMRDMGLLERVRPTMIQYRKNIVKHKWVKHRNHTYFELTSKGRNYLEYFLGQAKGTCDP